MSIERTAMHTNRGRGQTRRPPGGAAPRGTMGRGRRGDQCLEMLAGDGMWAVRVLLLSCAGPLTVSCYADLRGMPCRNVSTYSEVPANRTEWTGSVTLTLECDPGYDMPLNVPKDMSLTCFPNGSTWQPDYLPDCNDEVIPTTAQMTMYGYMSKATCDSLGPVFTSRDSLVFTSAGTMNLTLKCSQAQLHGCSVSRALTSCKDTAATGGSPPLIFLQVTFAIERSIPWSTYQRESAAVAGAVLRDLEPLADASQINVSTKPVCLPGSLPVQRAGSDIVCRGCSLGHYLDTEMKKCLPCKPGYYGDTVLSTCCKICPGLPDRSNATLTLWKTINSLVPNRAYGVSGCPVLVTLTNGSLVVMAPADINIAVMKEDLFNLGAKSVGADSKAARSGHLSDEKLAIYLTVACVILASV